MSVAHSQIFSTLGLEKPHEKRILFAWLLSILVHVIAWQWIWHSHSTARPFSLPKSLQVSFLAPVQTGPILSAPVPHAIPKPVPPSDRNGIHLHAVSSAASTANASTLVAEHSLALPASPPVENPITATEPPLTLPVYQAAYLNNPPPSYPLSAKRRGIEGKVLLRAEIQPDGKCSHVQLKKSSGWEMLDQAALQAVQDWRFEPAKQGAKTMVAWVEIPISFQLQN